MGSLKSAAIRPARDAISHAVNRILSDRSMRGGIGNKSSEGLSEFARCGRSLTVSRFGGKVEEDK